MSTGDQKLDEFESLFRSALSEVFHYQPPALGNVALVTDQDAETTGQLAEAVRKWLLPARSGSDAPVHALARPQWDTPEEPAIPRLLHLLERLEPDIVVTSRGLLGRTRDLPYTLGSVCDSLSQGQPSPLLLLPRLSADCLTPTARVLAVTNHLQGDDALVSWAASLCRQEGTLFLAHIEDDVMLQRYLHAIERIRGIETEVAKAALPAKLLELPRQYVATISDGLREQGVHDTVVPLVQMGHAMTDYRNLVHEHQVDLVVVNGRDDRQYAMHGLAHALAVGLRDLPLLVI